MTIIVDIDDNLYTRLFDNGIDNYNDLVDIAIAIRKGIPIPKSHGRIYDGNTKISIETGTKTDMIFGTTNKEEHTLDELLKNVDVPVILEADKGVEE